MKIFMKKKLLLAILASLFCAVPAFSQISDENTAKPAAIGLLIFENPDVMFEILKGRWVFSDMTCDNPYVVEVSKDKMKMAMMIKNKEVTEIDQNDAMEVIEMANEKKRAKKAKQKVIFMMF